MHASFHHISVQSCTLDNSGNLGALSWFSKISIPFWGLKKGFVAPSGAAENVRNLRSRESQGEGLTTLITNNLQAFQKGEWTRWFRVGTNGKMHNSQLTSHDSHSPDHCHSAMLQSADASENAPQEIGLPHPMRRPTTAPAMKVLCTKQGHSGDRWLTRPDWSVNKPKV